MDQFLNAGHIGIEVGEVAHASLFHQAGRLHRAGVRQKWHENPSPGKKVSLETYAKKREVALVQSLFDREDVKSKKMVSKGNKGGVTLSALRELPKLKASSVFHDTPITVLYELAELLALRQLRKGGLINAQLVYEHYLSPVLDELSHVGLSTEPLRCEAQQQLLSHIASFIKVDVQPPAQP